MVQHKLHRTTIQVRSAALNAKSQRARILRLLIDARGEWVPLPEIMACAAQYNARILELRRAGFNIENRTEGVDGARHSWFRLLNSSSLAAKTKTTKDEVPWRDRPRTTGLPLFDLAVRS
jgi:hypothetical protein